MGMLEIIQTRPKATVLYVVFICACIIIFATLDARESGAYDYLLTLSAGLQALAFALLVFDTESSAAEGLSEKTLWAFTIAHIARISTTFWGEGYVPEDNTSDVCLYQILELVSVLLLGFQLAKLAATRSMQDVGQGFERWSLLCMMTAFSLVMAYYTKSTGHNDYYADLSWMFSVWLEGFALAPQVQLLLAVGKVDESAAHFAGLTLSASATFAFFWCRVARDRYSEFEREGEHAFFWSIVLASLIRVGLCGVYFYLFRRSLSMGNTGTPGLGFNLPDIAMPGMPSLASMRGRPEYELCAQDDL